MNIFGLSADRVIERIERQGERPGAPSFSRSLLIGGAGFTLASLCVFATVAFAERAMYRSLGLSGAYAVWTILFILLGGAFLSPLVIGPERLRRFLPLFGAAFLLYAIGWVGSYFALRGRFGEWTGSLIGSVLMALVIALAFEVRSSLLKLAAILFVANSAGYFIGGAIFDAMRSRSGMILWGLVYGIFLGAGMGAAIYLAQTPLRNRIERSTGG